MTGRSFVQTGAAVLVCGACLAVNACSRRPAAPAAVDSAADAYVEGMRAYRAGDRETAARLLARAVRDNPSLGAAHSALGDLYKESGDYNAAATEYEALAKIDPYAADNFHRLAVSYHFLNRLRDAAASYLRAIKLNPSDWKSNMNLGLVYMALGDNNAAVEHCQRAVTLNPLSAAAHANLGVTYDARGNKREAEAAYRKALQIDPGQSGAALNLARNLEEQKRPWDAVRVMEQLTRTADSAAVRRRYGDALLAAGRDADGVLQYREALKLDPRYYPAMNALGAALISQYRSGLLLDDRKRDEAVSVWRRSLQLNPDQPRIEAQLKTWQPKAG